MNRIDNEFDLQGYLTKGVEDVIADAVKATLRSPSGAESWKTPESMSPLS